MTKHFDWTEGQPIPGVMISPGTGPVHDTSPAYAKQNVEVFVKDVLDGQADPGIEIEDTGKMDEGRYTFNLRLGDRVVEIDMPGIPIDEVRYLDLPSQDIFAFPRLYVDGSSWLWTYAISVTRDRLLGEDGGDE